MAKPKHQKPKPNKQHKQQQAKKRGGGKQNDVTELRAQLDPLGLKIIQVTADGNCFFRALADQLEGDEDAHDKYRAMVVQFIKTNREMFEPFVEDEVPFDDYCRSMGEDSTWAGNMELQAASLVTRSNICIHRNMSPRWYIHNFDKHEVRMIHLSYHDGEHYNSVRTKEDTCSGPARPIVIKDDAVLSANTDQPKTAATKSKEEDGRNVVHEETINLVKSGSGCEDASKVEQALQKVGGDVYAAVEILVAEQSIVDQTVGGDEFSEPMKASYDEPHYETPEQHSDEICKLDSSTNGAETSYKKNNIPQHDDKKISRNKACPCGSKKKYKSCCVTTQLTMGRVGKTESKVEKSIQLLRVPFNPMEVHPTWVAYASSGLCLESILHQSQMQLRKCCLRRSFKFLQAINGRKRNFNFSPLPKRNGWLVILLLYPPFYTEDIKKCKNYLINYQSRVSKICRRL